MAKHSAVPDERNDGAGAAGGGSRDGRSRANALRTVRGKAKHEGAQTLDRLIHERVRLGILSALAATDALSAECDLVITGSGD